MKTVILKVNGREYRLDVPPDTPLLWVLREELGLTGTKYGCGIGVCGACTVHLDGRAVRSCVLPAGSARGSIETIESVAEGRGAGLVSAWQEHNVPQCGYCQPGIVMALTALLESGEAVSRESLQRHLTNLCRCGTYPRVLRAALDAAAGDESS